MPASGNFTEVSIKDSVLTAHGQSSPVPNPTVVSRYVVVQQPARFEKRAALKIVHGPATKGDSWQTEPGIRAPGFEVGAEALATGTEAYLVADTTEPEAPPVFVTMTWSQVVWIAPG